MKSPYEHEYFLDLENGIVPKVSVVVHFCNIFNVDNISEMHKFLSVKMVQKNKLLFTIEAYAPFRDFIVTNYKKYTETGESAEISEQEFNKILENDW